METRVRMALLYDFYGPLLTQRQQQFTELYFGEDLSLGEIAAEFGISRQAVYDTLNRAEASLAAYEDRLKLVERFFVDKDIFDRLKQMVVDLMIDPLSNGQKDLVISILALIDQMSPEGD